jgi:hypothetical protein
MNRFLPFALAIVVMLLGIRCSTAPTDVAGGSGAGNPSGATAFAMIADTSFTSYGLSKSMAGGLPVFARTAPAESGLGRTFRISDESNMCFTVDTAWVVVQEIELLIDSTDARRPRLPALSDGTLLYRGDALVVHRERVFDLMTGAAFPGFDSIPIPMLRYCGMRLNMGDSEAAVGGLYGVRAGMPQSTPLVISGTCSYRDTIRDFCFKLPVANFNIIYAAPNAIEPSATGINRVYLLFDSKQWMQTIDIRTCLETGGIGFDASGRLAIESNAARQTCNGIEHVLRENIMRSGSLRTITP